jgi:hypothetical protein
MMAFCRLRRGFELEAQPYALAHQGQGWLGHRSITSTAAYAALAPNRFKDFWRE